MWNARSLSLPAAASASLVAIAFWLAPAVASEPVSAVASFERDAAPFFQKHCTSCHSGKDPEGELSLEQLASEPHFPAHAAKWQSVLEKLHLGQMPPDTEPQPSAAERMAVLEWLATAMRAAGVVDETQRKLRDFAYGNYVDHGALFSGEPKIVTPAEPRLWRFSPQIYAKAAEEWGRDGVASPFSLRSGAGVKDYAAAFVVDEASVVQLLRNASDVVEAQTRDETNRETGKVTPFGRAPRPIRTLVEVEGEPTDAQCEEAIRTQFANVMQRPPTPDELRDFTALLRKNMHDAGRATGVRATLAAVMLEPEAVFRFELGAGEPDEHGRMRLSPREIAYSINYALTDRRPQPALLLAAEQGKLATAEGVREQVLQLWDDPRTEKPRILGFFHEYFGYDKAPDVFKDPTSFGTFRANILVDDTNRLVQDILARDRDVLRELLTTNKSYVNYRVDRKHGITKAHDRDLMENCYNVAPDRWSKEQPMELPRDQRAGILTQPSWLVAHSGNTLTDPIRRGKWIRERLLGGTVPDVPITVDAQLPDTPEQTVRQRMIATSDQYCWKCHQQMNPLGLPMEAYDHLGRFRTSETVLDKPATAANVTNDGDPKGDIFHEVSLDIAGAITTAGEEKLNGEVRGPIEMIHRLANSEHVRQVFVRHAFRYFLGRNERLGDGPTLVAADEAYVASGGSFKALVVSLLTSDSFLYRQIPVSVGAE